MNCPTAGTWLLAARSARQLPEEVREHVAACPVCAAMQARLGRLDEAVRRLTDLPCVDARRRLAEALDLTPQDFPVRQPAAPRCRTVPRRTVTRRVAPLAAAVLLLAGGWLLGRFTTPHTARPPEYTAGVNPQVARPTPLIVRVAEAGTKAVESPSPRAQLEILMRFAAQVRGEAVRLAEVGGTDDIPRLGVVHDRVLRTGVSRQLVRLTGPERTDAGRELVQNLRTAAGETTAAADRFPLVVGDLLRPLAVSAGDVADAVQAGKAPADPVADWPTPPTSVDSSAALLVNFVNAEGPLARADASADFAGVLARALALLSAAGDPDGAALVGDSLNAVMAHGVADNLERAETADPTGKLAPEVARVRERAGRAGEVLERNWEKAPPAARKGLDRALEAAGKGRGKAAGKGGKPPNTGPPWKRDGNPPGKGGIPPGWLKKQ